MSDKIFPIHTETSCRLKWSWSTLYLNNGKTGSCHRASFSTIPNDFESFHNTEEKIRDRTSMLQGQWPGNGCEYCKNIEESGGQSDRLFQNQIPNVYPPELDQDTTLTSVDPTVLEVFFANTCNLKCVYCSSMFSSKIQAEDERYGGAIIPDRTFNYIDNQYAQLVPKFWEWFDKKSTTLQRLQILGGEPFLQNDIHVLIKKLSEVEHRNLELNLVTNLSLPSGIIDPILSQLSQLKVKRIDLLASIDSWDSSQQYVRHGLDLEQFNSNMKKILEQNIYRVGLLSTVSSLTLHGMPMLAKKYLEWNQVQQIFWYMHLVLPNNESVFDPTIFDYKVFEQSIFETRELLPKETWDDLRTLEVFDGIVAKLQKACSTNVDRQKQLLYFLNENDRRRNTNWAKEFPWLVTVFKENNVVQ